MRYLSVCSGIEAATVAWHPLGWTPVAFSEIEAFPRAVLKHHYPSVPLHGDFTKLRGDEDGPVDLLVGGTPCQSFSVAGLRKGMDDPRGNLALAFLALLERTRARWVVWENVPGVLSSNEGRDFGAFLGGLGELGYGWAYRVLDAQYFGVPQRRRRVFVVGYLGDWRRAAAVLFERQSLSGNPPPSREAREGIAAFTPGSIGGYRDGVGMLRSEGGDCGGGSEVLIAPCFTSNYGKQPDNSDTSRGPLLIAHSLRADGFDAGEDGTGRGTPLVAIAFDYSKSANAGSTLGLERDLMMSLRAEATPAIAVPAMAVRRITPREAERLQGFPDDYTLVPYRGKPAADGPRYKELGNSMAVPCMRWIGERIQMVEELVLSLDKESAA